MPDPYRGFRFPAEIISHAVWLYHCFSLSLREVETMLAQRGIVVSYESIRAWGLRFGRAFADTLSAVGLSRATNGIWTRCSSGSAASCTISGGRSTSKAPCSTSWSRAAQRQGGQAFFRTLLKGQQYVPRVIITDKLRSYAAAKRKILPGSSTARAATSTTGQRSRTGRRDDENGICSGSSRAACPAVPLPPGQIHNLFQLRRHLLTAPEHVPPVTVPFGPGARSPALPSSPE